MNTLPNDWFENNNSDYGYKWSIQAKYGTVALRDDDLLNREEFLHFATQAEKHAYARQQGWRFNVDSQMWYRIKGY